MVFIGYKTNSKYSELVQSQPVKKSGSFPILLRVSFMPDALNKQVRIDKT